MDIIIESQNPRDVKEEDLRSLAEVIAPAVADYRLGYAYYPPREGLLGVTWWEVVRIWLPDVASSLKDELTGALIALALDWARKRFRRKGAPKRPKYVAIYGPNGKVICSVLVKDDTSEPESRTEHERETEEKYSEQRTMPPVQGFFDNMK